jgi:hypothetical protein
LSPLAAHSGLKSAKGDGKLGQPVDPDCIMVRGLVRSHLDALKKQFPDLLGKCDVQASKGTDFA